MDAEKLREVLEKHKKWLNREDGGEQADLIGEDLSGVDLRGEDLREANLYMADLYGADLRWALCGAALCGADLRGVDLRWADLSGTNLDLSCWPLWCGSLDVIVDKRIAAQLAYHFCRIICDDDEVKAAQKALASLANQFHRVDECGRIEE